MATCKPDTLFYSDIKKGLLNGDIKLPRFQRDFVWDPKKMARLLDSVVKGYPIGSFIMWNTKEVLRDIRNIGSQTFPAVKDENYLKEYILDGQQRITSLYAGIEGVIDLPSQNKIFNCRDIYVDLTATGDDDIVILDRGNRTDYECPPLTEIVYYKLSDVSKKYKDDQEKIDKIQEYNEAITKYQFPVVYLNDAPMDIATEVFTRANISGKTLTPYEIMCAKIYDEKKGFDLDKKRDIQKKKWKKVGYDSIDDQTVLEAVSICLIKKCGRKDMFEIPKNDFISVWDTVDKAFDSAIDYLRQKMSVPTANILPYDAFLVLLVYFFYRLKSSTSPSAIQEKYLCDYFWRSALSERFTEGQAAKLRQDTANVIDNILAEKQPSYKYGVDISVAGIKRNGSYVANGAYTKAFICLLCEQTPLAFANNSKVVLDSAFLDPKNKKNDHHFFPKAYMESCQPKIPSELVDHIANISLIDAGTNSVVIGKRAPSDYISDFAKLNPNIDKAMESHLINITKDNIKENDYNKFFKNRLSRIRKILKGKLLLNNLDVV